MDEYEVVIGKDIQIGDFICLRSKITKVFAWQGVFYEVVGKDTGYLYLKIENSRSNVMYSYENYDWARKIRELKYDPKQAGDKDDDI